MFKNIQKWYREFIEDWKATSRTMKRMLTAAALVAAIMAAFAGHLFTAVAIAGVTYLFWRNKKGQDELVGTARL